ncbi:MAG: hypothetical protein C5S49_00835 [Candidatus Methanogaster sp.]|nr:MAG: hypothetical protein C5S49_00835 [ANME-2 cluster archaeon]
MLAVRDISLDGDEVCLQLSKNGLVAKEKILNEDVGIFTYISGNGGVNCVVDRVFRGCKANAVNLVGVNQYSDANGTSLIAGRSHLYKTGDPAGMAEELMDGCVLMLKDIDLQGDKIWLELSKDGIMLKEDLLRSDDLFEYGNGLESVDCVVEAVFRGSEVNIVRLKNVTQYSGTGVCLIDNESMTYPVGVNDRPMIGLWALEEGYSLSARDIDLNGNKVWLLLLKDGGVRKDAIIDSGSCDADRWFEYYNATGALVFSTYIDAVFRGTECKFVLLEPTIQYSEIDESVFEWAKKALFTGIIAITPPAITEYNPASYVSDPEGATREFNIVIDQPSDIIWYINGTVVKDTEKGAKFAYYTNNSAKTGYWNVSAVAINAKGTDMQAWWWAVNLSEHSTTGYRIWDASKDMSLDYTWTARSCTGFYYNIDDDIGTETLTIHLEGFTDRTIQEEDLDYVTTASDIDFEYNDWGSYKMLGFMAEMYFAGYEAKDTSTTNENIRLLSKDMLSKVLIDEDDKHILSTGASLELEEGYTLKIIQLDINSDQAQIELLKKGISVDTEFVESPDTYVYKKDIGELDDVPLVTVHIDSVFAGMESDMLIIDGIFQISDDPIPVDTGGNYGEMEIKSTSSYTITMDNSDDINLEEGEIVDIMGNLKFLVADDSTLRFALYERITGSGTYYIRGTVYDTNDQPTKWDHMNFEGFYYNLDDDLGTEELQVKEIRSTIIDEGDLVYATTPQLVSFDLSSEWGSYEVIGFMAEPYFAGYDGQETDNAITNDDISLISKDMLSKVLIDVDDNRTISTGASLQLEEGYELKIIQLDTGGGQAQIELLKNGRSVDTEFVRSPDTYVYKKDLGKLDNVPIVAVYIGSVFAGTETDMITIEGIFQISEDYKSVKAGDQYGEMEVTSTSRTGIAMKNPDDIDLDEGGITRIMGDIGFMTSEDGGRYALFVRRTVGPIAALGIELPERLIVGEEIVITVTADGSHVEGAQVRFAGENLGSTDPDGEVRFTPDAAGTFIVTASKANYNSASVAVRIIGGSAAADAMIALQLAVSGGWDAGADANGDGKITSLDALMILQMAAKDSGAVPEIVINELMPNPIGTDHGNEIVELYNCGGAEVDIGGWVLKNEDGITHNISAGTIIEPYGYYLTTKIQLDNSGGYLLLYRDGEEVDSSIEYTHSTEGVSWQRRTDGLDTDSDGDWIERDSTFGVPG